jgi:gluconolactonase
VEDFAGVQIDDPRLAQVLSPDAKLLCLYEGTLHGEGTLWDPARDRLVWSDVPNRRLLAWHPDGHVEVAIDGTYFMNGNALDAEGRLVHCEHGRRCISRSEGTGDPVPIITHFEGKRLNSPNDVTVASDGTIWFTDPTFGLLMPSQGSLMEPELDHRSVYRFDPRDGALRRMADFEQPNGLFFSPDGRTLYVSDTALSLNEIPGPETGKTHTRLRRSTWRRTAVSPIAASSVILITDIPTASKSTHVAGYGPLQETGYMSLRPRGHSSVTSPRRKSARIALLEARR